MANRQELLRGLGPTVVVTALPVAVYPLVDQPLYHVFLYYAIELVVMMAVLCAVTLIVFPRPHTRSANSDHWSSRKVVAIIASAVALGMFLAGIWLHNLLLCFIGAVAGFLVAPTDQPRVDWNLPTRVQFTLGMAPIALMSTGIISVMIWQMGAILSGTLTGDSPPADTTTWIGYLGDVSLPLLTAVIAVLMCGTAYQIHKEVISSGKYRQTTPDQLLLEYLKIGVGMPTLIWGLVLCSLAPVLVIVIGTTAIDTDWIAQRAFDVWIFIALGVYVSLQSYVDWHRLRSRHAWQRGNYERPLFPSKLTITLPLIGQITIAPGKRSE